MPAAGVRVAAYLSGLVLGLYLLAVGLYIGFMRPEATASIYGNENVVPLGLFVLLGWLASKAVVGYTAMAAGTLWGAYGLLRGRRAGWLALMTVVAMMVWSAIGMVVVLSREWDGRTITPPQEAVFISLGAYALTALVLVLAGRADVRASLDVPYGTVVAASADGSDPGTEPEQVSDGN